MKKEEEEEEEEEEDSFYYCNKTKAKKKRKKTSYTHIMFVKPTTLKRREKAALSQHRNYTLA